jgi:hypothetical protein
MFLYSQSLSLRLVGVKTTFDAITHVIKSESNEGWHTTES